MEAAVAVPLSRSPSKIRPWLLPSGVLVVCGLLFAAMWLPDSFNKVKLDAATGFCGSSPDGCFTLTERLFQISAHFFYYLAFALPGIALARLGRRRVAWVPFMVPVLLFWPWGGGTPGQFGIEEGLGVSGFARSDVVAHLVGMYHPTGFISVMPWVAHPSLALVISSFLVLLPAWFFGRGVSVDGRRVPLNATGVVSLIVCWLCVPAISWMASTHLADRLSVSDMYDLVDPWFFWSSIVFLFAVALGRKRPAWPWVHLAVPALLGVAVLPWVLTAGEASELLRAGLFAAVALLLVAYSAAQSDRVAAWMRDRRVSGDHVAGILMALLGIACAARVLVGGTGTLPWEAHGFSGFVSMLTAIVVLPVACGLGAVYLGRKGEWGERRWPGRVAGVAGELAVALGIVWLASAAISLVT